MNCPIQTSAESSVKRQQRDVHCGARPGSRVYTLPDQHLEHGKESIQCSSVLDAVVVLLMDLQVRDGASQDIDDQISALVGSICDHLTHLNITSISWNQDEEPFRVKITVASSHGEILLARLTPSDLTSSIADLAAHILHMLQ